MSKDQIIVGLDIGTTKVCAIVGKTNEFGKIDILGVGKAESDGVKRGVVVNIDKTVEAIKAAVASAESIANVSIKVVYVGIAGEHIRSMQQKGIITLNNPNSEITIDDVNRLYDEMFKIALQPGTEIIHVLPQEYTVDNEHGIIDPVGMSGVRLECNFHVVTAQTTAARNIFKCVERAGLQVAELVLEPIASSFSVLTEEEKEAGVCLVDIGGGTTDVAIFKDNIIRHTAVIPFGGGVITDDIKEGCSVMAKYAEQLKQKYGSAMASMVEEDEVITIAGLAGRANREIRRKVLSNIIQARAEEILEFVASEIKHAGFEKRKLVGGIVLTGGGAQLLHFRNLSELKTGFDTRLGHATEYLAKGMIEEVNGPIFATGTGLVIYGLKNGVISGPNYQMATSTDAIKKSPGSNFLSKIKSWFLDSNNIE